MKPRSLNKILLLNIVSLGFYEYYWLYSTRKEIVATYNVKVTKIWKLLVPYLMTIVLFGVILLIFFYYIPQSNQNGDNIKNPSQLCLIEYGKSSGVVSSDGLTQTCKDEVDNFYATQDKVTHDTTYLLGIAGVSLALIFLLGLYYYRWYKSYAQAVAQVIGGGASVNALIVGINSSPVLTMIMLQWAFNSIAQSPTETSGANFTPSTITHKYIKYLIPYTLTTFVLSYLAGMAIYFMFIK